MALGGLVAVGRQPPLPAAGMGAPLQGGWQVLGPGAAARHRSQQTHIFEKRGCSGRGECAGSRRVYRTCQPPQRARNFKPPHECSLTQGHVDGGLAAAAAGPAACAVLGGPVAASLDVVVVALCNGIVILQGGAVAAAGSSRHCRWRHMLMEAVGTRRWAGVAGPPCIYGSGRGHKTGHDWAACDGVGGEGTDATQIVWPGRRRQR